MFVNFIVTVVVLVLATMLYLIWEGGRTKQKQHQEAMRKLEAVPRIAKADERTARQKIYDNSHILGEYLKRHTTYGSILALEGHNAVYLKFVELLPSFGVFENFEDLEELPGSESNAWYGRTLFGGKIEGQDVWAQINYRWSSRHEWDPKSYDDTYVEQLNGQNNRLRTIEEIFLVVPRIFTGAKKREALYALLHQCAAVVKEPKKRPHTRRYWNMTKSFGRYVARPETAEMTEVFPLDYADLLYDPAYVKKGKEILTPKVSFLIPFVTRYLTNEKNPMSFAIYGDAGTGKSKLAEEIVWAAAESKYARVFLLSVEQVKIFFGGNPDIDGQLTDVFNPDYRNIIFVDQAEGLMQDVATTNAFKELVEGPRRKKYNLAFIMTFNGQPSDFKDPALFRTGRIFPFGLGLIHATATRLRGQGNKPGLYQAVADLMSHTGVTPDMKKLQARIKASEGETKASGWISLADIFEFFRPNIEQITLEQIQEMEEEIRNNS